MDVPFANARKGPARRPVALVCYICGREYGTKSLPIHVKTCKVKWEKEQDLLPKKQRRPCPKAPENFDMKMKGISTGKMSAQAQASMMQDYNEKAFAKWDGEALLACKNCARTFLAGPLNIHMKSCKKGKPLKMRGATYRTTIQPPKD